MMPSVEEVDETGSELVNDEMIDSLIRELVDGISLEEELVMGGSSELAELMVVDSVIGSSLLDGEVVSEELLETLSVEELEVIISVEVLEVEEAPSSVLEDEVVWIVGSTITVKVALLDVEDTSSVLLDEELVEDVSVVAPEVSEEVLNDVSMRSEELVEVVSSLDEELSDVADEKVVIGSSIAVTTTVVVTLVVSVVELVETSEEERVLEQVGVTVDVEEVTGRQEHALVIDGPGATAICRLPIRCSAA